MKITERGLRRVIRNVIEESWRQHSKIDSIKYGRPERQSQASYTKSREGDRCKRSLSSNLNITFEHCGDKFIHSSANPEYYAVKIVLSGSDVDDCKRKFEERFPVFEPENFVKVFRFKYTCGMASAANEMLSLGKVEESKTTNHNPFGLLNPAHEAAYLLMQKDIRAPRNRISLLDDGLLVASARVNLHSSVDPDNYGGSLMDVALHDSINFKEFCDQTVKFILSQYSKIR